ncbi:transposase [Streptomyces sp. DW26H14]|uniref:transposase n=1 Tax=Streptomyces sp. DW26H14 TaxID=3435395 RepID=UPI00403DB6B3
MLLDLDGLAVTRVERLADGTRRVHLATADEAARACPTRGVFARRSKGFAHTRPRDLPYGERKLELVWRKRRWYCTEPACPRRTFTEQVSQVPAGARITERLRNAAGHRVRDAGSTVDQAARDLRLSWPTVMDVTDTRFSTMWNALIDAGTIGMTLLTAWIAKERLRDLLACARTGAGHDRIGRLRYKFLTWCADSEIPEVRRLATTVDRWWREIAAFIATGRSNAKSEGINRVIKLVARTAHGSRNPANQRLRTHCVTTRPARGHLHPA